MLNFHQEAKKIKDAFDKDFEVTIKISENNLTGDIILPLTKAQFNKITKSKTGVELTLSKAQLKYIEKTGGFLPILAALIAAAGGLAGGIATTKNSTREASEKARHNREIEILTAQGLGSKEGETIERLSNQELIGRVPTLINGRVLSNTLSKYGLAGNTRRLRAATFGNGLYLKRERSGLFLERA